MIKKSLAWLLTLCMVLSIMPLSVFATNEADPIIKIVNSDNDDEDDLKGSETPVEADLTIATKEQLLAFADAVNGGDRGDCDGHRSNHGAVGEGDSSQSCDGQAPEYSENTIVETTDLLCVTSLASRLPLGSPPLDLCLATLFRLCRL